MTEARPDIMLIEARGWRGDFQGYLTPGGIQTPALDALSREAVSFRLAFSEGPMSTSAVPSLLKDAACSGYRVWHEPDEAQGMSGMATEAARYVMDADRTAPLAVHLQLSLESAVPSGKSISTDALPQRIPTPDWSRKPGALHAMAETQGRRGWGQEEWATWRVAYAQRCQTADQSAGVLIEALKRTGRYRDCALVLLSTCGDYAGDYGLTGRTRNTFEDCLMRVPLLIKAPADRPSASRVSDTLVQTSDALATLYAWAGVVPRGQIPGRSLVSRLVDDTVSHRDAVYAVSGSQDDRDEPCSMPTTPAAMCRTRNFKFIRRLREEDEFYDLRRDPQELDNQIGNPELRAEICAHRLRLLDWYLESCGVVRDSFGVR